MGYPIDTEGRVVTEVVSTHTGPTNTDLARSAHAECAKRFLRIKKWHITLTGTVPSKAVKHQMYSDAHRLIGILGLELEGRPVPAPRSLPEVEQLLTDVAHILARRPITR